MSNTNIKVGADMSSFDESIQKSANEAAKSFEKIVNTVKASGSNVKKELREVTNAMQSLLSNGIGPTSEQYQKLAKRAGELKDAIADVNEEIQAQANDTRNMSLAFGALADGLNVFQAGQAAMALFGVENEDVTKTIQKMIAAQQVCNSIQAIGNSITSKSTVLGKAYAAVKGAIATRASIEAAAEGAATAATAGLTVAEGGATVATTALSAALNALPFVGIATAIAAASVGLIELAKHIINNTDEAKNAKAVLETLEEANKEAAKSFVDARLELDKYTIQIENFVGTEADEKKMVEELNQKYGDVLGTYKSLSEWKGTLVSQGQAYCEMLEEEAKAQVLAAKMGELYVKSITGEIDAKDYASQVTLLRKAWEDTIVTVGSYRNLLRQTLTPEATPKKTSRASGGGRGGKRGSSGSITDTLHTMEQVDALIDSLKQKMNAETDLAKKLDLSNQLKQIQTFKSNIEEISAIKAPEGSTIADLTGKGEDFTESIKTRLADLGKVLDEFNQKQIERQMALQESIASFKESLSGNVGSMAEDFGMLAKMFQDGNISATDAAAGLALMGDALKDLGQSGPIAKAGATLAAIGQIILGFAQASAQAGSLGPFGWLAFVGAGLGAVASTIATIQGFNSGGIVRGAGAGDTVPAMLTPGEAVLTKNDQARLWRLLRGGGSTGIAPDIHFTIRGSDLVGALTNLNDIAGKI